jgi:isopentenyl diphosphate isomerase/L-lactate dehydrogenase-like FMN-dependent dehydrogenase
MSRRYLSLTRRTFLAGLGALPALPHWAESAESQPPAVLYHREPPPLSSADQVLNVMGFEALARSALPPAHYAYIATGVDDDLTVARNHEAFAHYEIRARRFADLSHIDTARTVLGERWASPLYLSAVSSMRAFHPEAEVAVAAAARTRSTRQMLSSGCSATLEEVSAAAGQPPWQQLYPTDDWDVTLGIVRRAERAGCAAVVVTLDGVTRPRNNETLALAMRSDSRVCSSCHRDNAHDMWLKGPMFAGLDVSRVTDLVPKDMSVRWFDRLRAAVKVRLFAKGIVTGEDAALAVAHGADAVIVSNHGGRNEETLRASIDCVPEVVAAVHGKVPVFVDGGFRRGTDIFKALALGATAVGIGRPQAWGLAAFGQPGVEAVIGIFNRELADIMRQAGTPSLAAITPAHVLRSGSA